ncbi:MAG TPA: laccase domain-containing protein [Candidatus Paceibacterota bacterium]
MYQLPKLSQIPGLIHAFSDKEDGNMAVKFGPEEEVYKNRSRFLKKLNIESRQAVLMEVQHGTDIQFVDEGDGGKGVLPDVPGYKVDALVAEEDKIFPFLLVGDCLPIILYDNKNRVTALAHLGWRNTDKKFIQLLIEELKKECGTNASDLMVGMGPAIHKESYVFGEDEIADRKLNWSQFLIPMEKGRVAVDIIGYNLTQMTEVGIRPENIEISKIDTAQSSNYFSHYRSARIKKDPEGRIAAIAGMAWK